MNQNLKTLLCALLAVMVVCAMTACRSGGEATVPSDTAAIPTETAPDGEVVEDWNVPTETETLPGELAQETTEPVQEPDGEDPTAEPTAPDETDPTEPDETDPAEPTTQPTQPQAGTQEPVVLSYEEYMALSPAEQQSYYETFPSLEDYIAWHNAALAEYEANQDTVVATGPVDIGDYMNP